MPGLSIIINQSCRHFAKRIQTTQIIKIQTDCETDESETTFVSIAFQEHNDEFQYICSMNCIADFIYSISDNVP